jgi:hypothetical protein
MDQALISLGMSSSESQTCVSCVYIKCTHACVLTKGSTSFFKPFLFLEIQACELQEENGSTLVASFE